MMRLTFLTSALVLVVVAFTLPSSAQMYGYGNYAGFYDPFYGPIMTPEIHLGSATEPSLVRLPPVFVATPLPGFPGEYGETEPGDMTAAAMHGGFDYLVSPVGAYYFGSMDDSSVSLGDYAREIRSQKHGPPPIVLRP